MWPIDTIEYYSGVKKNKAKLYVLSKGTKCKKAILRVMEVSIASPYF